MTNPSNFGERTGEKVALGWEAVEGDLYFVSVLFCVVGHNASFPQGQGGLAHELARALVPASCPSVAQLPTTAPGRAVGMYKRAESWVCIPDLLCLLINVTCGRLGRG